MTRSQAQMVATLREHALLADGERAALVGPRGDIAWMCFPGFDDDAVFSSLMDGAGHYSVTPLGRFVWGGYYEEGTLVWRSRWVLDDGAVIECREALALPTEPGHALLLRQLTAVDGAADVHVELDLRPDWGRRSVQWHRCDRGGWAGSDGVLHARWIGSAETGPRGAALSTVVRVTPQQSHEFVLELSSRRLGDSTSPPQLAWKETLSSWERLIPALEGCAGRRDARHAVAVMRGLTTSGGGMVAAATTSLPERADSGRSYDYRFVWIRDQAYAGLAAGSAGVLPLLDAAVRFSCARLLGDGADLRPLYRTSGDRIESQHQLEHLRGYPGGQTVMLGNQAGAQFQLDTFGESLLLLAEASRHDRLDADGWRAAAIAAGGIEKRWHDREAGIWETHPDHWTHSRLICSAGLRQMARCGGAGERLSSHWLALADAILAECTRTAQTVDGRWQRAIGDARVDAALLLPALRGAVAADDPRSRNTLRAVLAELTRDGYCYRYRPDRRALGEAEGAFNLCNFWVCLAYIQQGEMVEAGRWFERARATCGPPGLFTEEFDTTQRQFRGNLPQAFVHAELLECAAGLASVLP